MNIFLLWHKYAKKKILWNIRGASHKKIQNKHCVDPKKSSVGNSIKAFYEKQERMNKKGLIQIWKSWDRQKWDVSVKKRWGIRPDTYKYTYISYLEEKVKV